MSSTACRICDYGLTDRESQVVDVTACFCHLYHNYLAGINALGVVPDDDGGTGLLQREVW